MPSLIHGDLWDENSGADLQISQPMMYDASVFYGHNEYDILIGILRREMVCYGRVHVRQCLRHMPPSEPGKQWNDGKPVHCIKYKLSHAIGWPGTVESPRQTLV